jgi:putative molybdopterin biosynthesis protein
MPDIPVKVVALVGREQGLIVKRGNPKGMKGLEDLTKPEVRFVNRQRGAGTRVLLDYHLNLMTIHRAHCRLFSGRVYSSRSCGRCCLGPGGLRAGIAAAAQALDLDFIPFFQERYDLVIPRQHLRTATCLRLFLDFWPIAVFGRLYPN